jgi:hypothetical protein
MRARFAFPFFSPARSRWPVVSLTSSPVAVATIA